MLMRQFVELSDIEERDSKILTREHRKFLVEMERAAGL